MQMKCLGNDLFEKWRIFNIWHINQADISYLLFFFSLMKNQYWCNFFLCCQRRDFSFLSKDKLFSLLYSYSFSNDTSLIIIFIVIKPFLNIFHSIRLSFPSSLKVPWPYLVPIPVFVCFVVFGCMRLGRDDEWWRRVATVLSRKHRLRASPPTPNVRTSAPKPNWRRIQRIWPAARPLPSVMLARIWRRVAATLWKKWKREAR